MSCDAAPYLSHTAVEVVGTFCCTPPATRLPQLNFKAFTQTQPSQRRHNPATVLPSSPLYQHAACFTAGSSHLHHKDDRALLGSFQNRKCAFVSKQHMWLKEADGVLSVVIAENWLPVTVTSSNSVHAKLFTVVVSGPGSSVGVATELPGWTVRDRIPVGTRFSARPDQPWGPPSLL